MVDCAYFVKSTPLIYFLVSLDLSARCRYVTDILKMCIKKFDDEKIFSYKMTGFLS